MANRHRGEATFQTAAGVSITLAIDFDALAEAEDQANMPIQALLDGLSKGRIKAMRAIAFGATRRYHPDLTADDLADMLLSPDSAPLAGAISKAASAAFPAPDESAGGKAKPKTGTGTRSKPTGRRPG